MERNGGTFSERRQKVRGKYSFFICGKNKKCSIFTAKKWTPRDKYSFLDTLEVELRGLKFYVKFNSAHKSWGHFSKIFKDLDREST